MDFQQEYIDEVKKILKDLEQSLMQLERNANNVEEINNVYRYLHTLKGSAGMFGFHHVESLAHELESLYSDVQDGVRSQDEFLLDLTLSAVDIFSDAIEGKDVSREVKNMVDSIHTLQDGSRHNQGIPSGTSSKQQAYSILITPEQEIFKRGINLQHILDDLHELEFVEMIVHNETIPFEKQFKDKEITSWFEILAVTDRGLTFIKDILLFMKEKEYHILTIQHPSDFCSETYAHYIRLEDEELVRRVNILKDWIPAIFEEEVQDNSEAKDGDELQPTVEDNTIITKKKERKNAQVSVSTRKLDQLINIVSELVTFRSEVQHLLSDQKNQKVAEAMEKLEMLTLQLRDSAFNIRLAPLSIIHVKLQRLVRSVSKELGKEVDFITEGMHTELDRSMISALEAPLMHIIRNSLDHGIETPKIRASRNKPEKGLLKLYSYNSGDHVFIQIQDDGNGLDFKKIHEKGVAKGLLDRNQKYSEKELINVMMSPGFSTADQVTSVSGRGVGMDVVKKEIAGLRGDIEVSTEDGLGTIFTLRLPLTLTVLDTLVVDVSSNKYLIPINEIEYCYEQEHAELFNKKSRQINFKGELTPFISLREYFGANEYPTHETVVVINKNDTRVAVVVDRIVGKLQTVYKPLNELLQPIECFSGASILGDGSTALILDALKLNN